MEQELQGVAKHLLHESEEEPQLRPDAQQHAVSHVPQPPPHAVVADEPAQQQQHALIRDDDGPLRLSLQLHVSSPPLPVWRPRQQQLLPLRGVAPLQTVMLILVLLLRKNTDREFSCVLLLPSRVSGAPLPRDAVSLPHAA